MQGRRVRADRHVFKELDANNVHRLTGRLGVLKPVVVPLVRKALFGSQALPCARP